MSHNKPILTYFDVSYIQSPGSNYHQAFLLGLGLRSGVCDLSKTFHIYLLSFSLTQSPMKECFLVT